VNRRDVRDVVIMLMLAIATIVVLLIRQALGGGIW
jgi:hypothetical protein